MKITENGNTLSARETLKFSQEEKERIFEFLYENGITLQEAYEDMKNKMADVSKIYFDKENFIFSEMYINKELKLKTDWKNKAIKYQKFYEYIKYLLKNANLDEKLVREKIEEMEKEKIDGKGV